MEIDDKLYKSFLEEMHALENFRVAYASEHPTTPLDRDDPDVRRLLEALALFAARTRNAGLRNIVATRRRIFRQFLPYLLSPLPAMGTLRAVPTGRFAEPVVLPRRAEISLRGDGDKAATFTTLGDLRVLPLDLGRVTTLVMPQKASRLRLPFETPYPRNDEIGTLNLRISYLNDFKTSLRVMRALQQNLRRAAVSFEDIVDEDTKGTPCSVDYGLPDSAAAELWPNPLQRERAYFHYPDAELYLCLKFPAPPRNWQRFTLILDLGPKWPSNLRLTREAFELFTVPIVNQQRTLAQPLLHDGKKDQAPIRHPSAGAGFKLVSLAGVYRVVDGAMIALRSAALAGGTGSYEVDEDPLAGGDQRHVLQLHLPEDFGAESTISIDADWYQPWISSCLKQRLRVAPYQHSFAGLDWELSGGVVPHRQVNFSDELDDFTHVLVLQNKTLMNIDDLKGLLQVFGSVWTGHFGAIRDLIEAVEVKEAPLPGDGAGRGIKIIYTLRFKEHEPTMAPLIDAFVMRVGRVLDAWVAEAPVEVRQEVAS